MKYFIITGASKGLGEGIALALLNENHHLLCVSRSESKILRERAAEKKSGYDFIEFDLSDTDAIPHLTEIIFKKIDQEKAKGLYLVNNAGVLNPVERIENCSPEEIDAHIRINLTAPMILSSGFIKKCGQWPVIKRILNISSGAAQNPYYGWSSYCTSKAGLDMFTRCIATEQDSAKYPVYVTAIAPGIIDTDMQAEIRSTTEEQFIHRQRFIELKESGQLVSPELAGKHLAEALLSEDFHNGDITDIRHKY